MEKDQIKCFVNGHLVVATKDKQLKPSKVGLVKFRNTNPDFKHFAIGQKLEPAAFSNQVAVDAIVTINPDAIDLRMMRVQLRGMTDRKSQAIEDIDWLTEKNARWIRLRTIRCNASVVVEVECSVFLVRFD